jgi:mycofactocin system glycosyltransferase
MEPTRSYVLDASTKIIGDVAGDGESTVIGGSPLRLFRLTAAGRSAFDAIAAGTAVASSRLTERLLDAGAIHPLRPPREADGHHRHTEADVTVVVPTHETDPARLYDILRHCLDSAGVMFVDDGSGTPLTGVRGATLVRLRHNSGPAAARNAGVRAAESPIVAFVDTDVDLVPGWLDGLLWHFDDPRVGYVAPRVASGPAVEGGDSRVAKYEERHSPLDLGGEPARIAPGTRVSYVPAAVLLVRKVALDEIGGFDAGLRCGEDVDAVWRLHAAGWRGRYEPAVVVLHHPRPSWRALAAQRRAYGESAAALASVHGNAVAPVRMSAWSLGVWGLAAAGRPLSAAGMAGGTALALIPKLRGVPASESLRLAGRGHLAAGRSLATAMRRTWLPFVGLGAVWSRRARWITAAAVVPAMFEGGPARLFDDVSYGVGVWKGVLGRRRLAPVLPAVVSWPRPDDVAPSVRRRFLRRGTAA